jgi:hypothetical protein
MKLTEREEEILYQLPNDWCRPMDIGGRDGSDHSAVLKRLAEKGYAERCRRNTLRNEMGSRRGSYVYRRKQVSK